MSGFTTDPQFDIIMMPDDNDPESTDTDTRVESEEDLDAQDGTDRVK